MSVFAQHEKMRELTLSEAESVTGGGSGGLLSSLLAGAGSLVEDASDITTDIESNISSIVDETVTTVERLIPQVI
ncbi:hypothetical protein ACSN7O_004770 [Enterobacter chuandaensis]